MSGYYDRQGQPMEFMEWARQYEVQDRIVARTLLPNGLTVSTVWLGLDHSWGEGPPLIFETMVFTPGGSGIAQIRYSTEGAAVAGHAVVCGVWRLRPNRRLKKRVWKKQYARGRDEFRKMGRRLHLRHQRWGAG